MALMQPYPPSTYTKSLLYFTGKESCFPVFLQGHSRRHYVLTKEDQNVNLPLQPFHPWSPQSNLLSVLRINDEPQQCMFFWPSFSPVLLELSSLIHCQEHWLLHPIVGFWDSLISPELMLFSVFDHQTAEPLFLHSMSRIHPPSHCYS